MRRRARSPPAEVWGKIGASSCGDAPMSEADRPGMPFPNAFELDPRLVADTHRIGDLALSRVLLFDDARFPWLVLVPRLPGLRDLIDLARDDQHRLLDEVNRCAHVLHALDRPHKLNIAALGNVVPQLHVHIIARFRSDAVWPRPVWGQTPPTPYGEADRAEVVSRLRRRIWLQP
jgi:diadenosine tetraphosphate (Ap4A) HIT family hydrolase